MLSSNQLILLLFGNWTEPKRPKYKTNKEKRRNWYKLFLAYFILAFVFVFIGDEGLVFCFALCFCLAILFLAIGLGSSAKNIVLPPKGDDFTKEWLQYKEDLQKAKKYKDEELDKLLKNADWGGLENETTETQMGFLFEAIKNVAPEALDEVIRVTPEILNEHGFDYNQQEVMERHPHLFKGEDKEMKLSSPAKREEKETGLSSPAAILENYLGRPPTADVLKRVTDMQERMDRKMGKASAQVFGWTRKPADIKEEDWRLCKFCGYYNNVNVSKDMPIWTCENPDVWCWRNLLPGEYYGLTTSEFMALPSVQKKLQEKINQSDKSKALHAGEESQLRNCSFCDSPMNLVDPKRNLSEGTLECPDCGALGGSVNFSSPIPLGIPAKEKTLKVKKTKARKKNPLTFTRKKCPNCGIVVKVRKGEAAQKIKCKKCGVRIFRPPRPMTAIECPGCNTQPGDLGEIEP